MKENDISLKIYLIALFLPISLAYASMMLAEEPSEAKVEPVAEPSADSSASLEKEPNKAEEVTELSKRMDPKRIKYMKGQLAYWFEDYKTAHKIWKPLAEDGQANAQATFGWLYHQGLGVEKDYKIAFDWYKKSAEQDYIIAQHNLGTLYEHGLGVEQNYKEAVKWYQLGAEKAYGNSVYNLGLMYLNARGVEKDKDKAIHLFKSAHQLKVEEAVDALADLGIVVEVEKPIEHNPQMMRHDSFSRQQEDDF